MKEENWIWMPHPGHLCVSQDCRFFLNTYVGGYIVSTVGEYLPDNAVLKIYAQSRKYPLTLASKGDAVVSNFLKENGGFEDIGYGRKYETMVFNAVREKDPRGVCCPWRQTGSDLAIEGYNDAIEAAAGHMKFCRKYSKKSGEKEN